MSAVTPAVFYEDPKAALAWLEKAFGFEISMLVTDEEGKLAHSTVSWKGAEISVGAPFVAPELIGAAKIASPRTLSGAVTQFLRIEIEEGIDAHCERARAAGARITQEPADQFYGARVYRALDPEGHVWTFHQEIAEVSAEAAKAGEGLTIREYPNRPNSSPQKEPIR
ncbi:MAG: VOC family protein [Caulobacteraceae bacterium]